MAGVARPGGVARRGGRESFNPCYLWLIETRRRASSTHGASVCVCVCARACGISVRLDTRPRREGGREGEDAGAAGNMRHGFIISRARGKRRRAARAAACALYLVAAFCLPDRICRSAFRRCICDRISRDPTRALET